MKRFISTAAATVTLVLSLSTQAMSAVGKAHDQIKASPITALDRHSDIIIELNSEQEEETYFNLGAFRLLLGDMKGAIENFDQAISINPNFAEAYGNRGFARLLLGDMKGAIGDFDQAISINPNFALAYGNRGIARLQLGDEKGATEDLQKGADILQKQGNTVEYQKVINIIKQINNKSTAGGISYRLR